MGKKKPVTEVNSANPSSVQAGSIKSRRLMVGRKQLIIVAGLVILIGVAVTLLVRRNSNAPAPELTDLTQTNSDQEALVKKYSGEYGEVTKELSTKDPGEWDKASLDKAYMSLLYADKVGAFAQVYSMLASIEAAQKSGLNIDDNSYHVDQSMRDAIRQRADENLKKATTKSKVPRI